VLGLTKYGLGLETVVAINAAKLLGSVLGTVFRFWSYRTFVFKPKRETVVTTTPSPGISADAARLSLPRRLKDTPIDLELEVELAVADLRTQSTRAD
jgi:hypothetical protein